MAPLRALYEEVANRRLRAAPPSVAPRRCVVLWAKKTWVTPTVGILPPLRGSDINSMHPWVTCTPLASTSPTAGILPSLRDSCGLHPQLGSCHRYAVLMFISYFPWVTCALRTAPTAKFHSPLRGCCRALTGAIFCCVFRGLRSLRR